MHLVSGKIPQKRMFPLSFKKVMIYANPRKNEILSIDEIWGEQCMTGGILAVNFVWRVSCYKLKVHMSDTTNSGSKGKQTMYLSIYRLTPRKREVEENLRTLGTTTANFYNLQEYRSVSNQRQVGFPPSIWQADAKTFPVEDGWIISSQEGARYRHT